jgi:hypothetical protein
MLLVPGYALREFGHRAKGIGQGVGGNSGIFIYDILMFHYRVSSQGLLGKNKR